jgi:hypothetical protein
MTYTLLTGEFVIRYPDLPRSGPQPDGDTVKFAPDTPSLVHDLPRPRAAGPDINERGISVRLEAIDALETHFEGAHQELAGANAARDELLRALGFTGVTFFPELPNTVASADQDRVRGRVLSNGIDANGRMIGFVEPGDGTGARRHAGLPRRGPRPRRASVNGALLAAGLAYPALYSTLPASLRDRVRPDGAGGARRGGGGCGRARPRTRTARADRGPRGARDARAVAEAVPDASSPTSTRAPKARRLRRLAARRPGQPRRRRSS